MEGWKNVLREYFSKKISVKILFKYPNLDGVVIRTGSILKIEDECFSMDDVKSGPAWYAYTFISQIIPEVKE